MDTDRLARIGGTQPNHPRAFRAKEGHTGEEPIGKSGLERRQVNIATGRPGPDDELQIGQRLLGAAFEKSRPAAWQVRGISGTEKVGLSHAKCGAVEAHVMPEWAGLSAAIFNSCSEMIA